MNKTYTEPFFIQIKPNDYLIKSDAGGTLVRGGFDWGMVKSNNDLKDNQRLSMERVQLMRLWTLQLTSQMAQGKAYTNEAEANVGGLTVEELETYTKLNNKLVESVIIELEKNLNSLVIKKTLKKL